MCSVYRNRPRIAHVIFHSKILQFACNTYRYLINREMASIKPRHSTRRSSTFHQNAAKKNDCSAKKKRSRLVVGEQLRKQKSERSRPPSDYFRLTCGVESCRLYRLSADLPARPLAASLLLLSASSSLVKDWRLIAIGQHNVNGADNKTPGIGLHSVKDSVHRALCCVD